MLGGPRVSGQWERYYFNFQVIPSLTENPDFDAFSSAECICSGMEAEAEAGAGVVYLSYTSQDIRLMTTTYKTIKSLVAQCDQIVGISCY